MYLIILAAGGDEVLVRAAEARVDGEMALRQAAEAPHERTRTYTHTQGRGQLTCTQTHIILIMKLFNTNFIMFI